MGFTIRPVSGDDWKTVTAIFNHFVLDSFAAYPEQPIDASIFRDRHEANPTYPFVVAEIEGRVVGFAFLAPYHPVPTMSRTATITYFLDPEETGRGLGARLLDHLIDAAGPLAISNILAHVSSMNPGSIRFHLKHGFAECGRFANVGIKNGHAFDMVWLQRELDPDVE